MVKHIVLFKLKESLSNEEKLQIASKFKEAIEALTAYIPSIRKIFVGININENEKWDICLDSSFDSMEDVKAYSVHPNHIAAAQIIKDYKADRACCDYEI